MNIQTQTTTHLVKLAELIEGINVAMLTTSSEAHDLESRPMAPLEMDSEGAIWFLTSSDSEKTHHLKHVNLSLIHAGRGTFISLTGHGHISTDREHIRRLWSPLAKPWFPEGPDSPDVVLFKFVPTKAEYWDAPHSRTVRLFALAASVIAGQPIGMGEHGTLAPL